MRITQDDSLISSRGDWVGQKMAMAALKRLPGRIFIEINKRVGFRLLTKFGEKGLINLVRAIPVPGGLIGGGVDAAWTKAISNQARDIFIPD